MKILAWALVPAIILTLLYIFTPVVLWLTDLVFRKPLEQRLFKVNWNAIGISAAILCWLLYLISLL